MTRRDSTDVSDGRSTQFVGRDLRADVEDAWLDRLPRMSLDSRSLRAPTATLHYRSALDVTAENSP